MVDGKFNVVFSGKVTPNKSEEDVKLALAQLFKTKVAQIERLFSGNQVTVKKDLSYAQAMKYQAALKQAGALALLQKVEDIESTDTLTENPGPATSPVDSTKAQTQPNVVSGKAQFGEKAKQIDVVSPASTEPMGGLSVAAAGEVIPGIARPVSTDVPDVSGYELGKEGEPLQALSSPEKRDVDTSSLSLASAGEPIPNQENTKAPVDPDISHLTIE